MSGFSLWSRLRNTSIIYGSRVLTSINYGSNTWMLKFDRTEYPSIPLSEALIPSGLRGAPRRDSTSSREPPVRSKRVLAKAALTPPASKTDNLQRCALLDLRLFEERSEEKRIKGGAISENYKKIYSFGLEQYISIYPRYLSFIYFYYLHYSHNS